MGQVIQKEGNRNEYESFTCQFEPSRLAWVFGIVYGVVGDLVFVIMFVNPIRKVTKVVNRSSSKLTKKMLGVGYKYTILCSVSFVSTFFTIFFGLYMFGLDSLDASINSICLMFMTPYYPDKKYFN